MGLSGEGAKDQKKAGIVADRRPAKSGEFDGTIMLADAVSRKAGRGLVAEVLEALKRRKLALRMLFDLSLPQYEAAMRRAAQAAGLEHLKLTPHAA